LENQRKKKISKHQAIFSLDYPTWQTLVDAYGDSKAMIAHRNTDLHNQMSAGGWYN
jgi:hypothetical protein